MRAQISIHQLHTVTVFFLDQRLHYYNLEFGFVNQRAPRDIGDIWCRRFTGPWYEFKQVPQDIKIVLFDEFKSKYSYDEKYEFIVKKIWEKYARSTLKNRLFNAKLIAMKQKKTDNIEDCKDNPPNWIPQEHWCTMIDKVWSQEDYKKKGKQMSANRLTKKEGTCTRHTAGSVSIASHNKQIESVTGVKPEFNESFDYWHVEGDPTNMIKGTKRISKNSKYVDNKSAKTMEMYKQKKSDLQESIKSFNPQLWVEAAGGLTKGSVYGAPHLDTSILHGGSGSFSTKSSFHGSASTQSTSTQPTSKIPSIEEIGAWVLARLTQSTMPPQPSMSPQPTMIPQPTISPQPTMIPQPTIPPQPTILLQSQMPMHPQQTSNLSQNTGTFTPSSGQPTQSFPPHMSGGYVMQPSMSSFFHSTEPQNGNLYELLQQLAQSSRSHQPPCSVVDSHHNNEGIW